MVKTEDIWNILSEVLDPDLGVSVVELGLIYDVNVSGDQVKINYTLTSPLCPHGDLLAKTMEEAVQAQTGLKASLRLLWDPPWTQDRISDELKLSMGLPIDL